MAQSNLPQSPIISTVTGKCIGMHTGAFSPEGTGENTAYVLCKITDALIDAPIDAPIDVQDHRVHRARGIGRIDGAQRVVLPQRHPI